MAEMDGLKSKQERIKQNDKKRQAMKRLKDRIIADAATLKGLGGRMGVIIMPPREDQSDKIAWVLDSHDDYDDLVEQTESLHEQHKVFRLPPMGGAVSKIPRKRLNVGQLKNLRELYPKPSKSKSTRGLAEETEKNDAAEELIPAPISTPPRLPVPNNDLPPAITPSRMDEDDEGPGDHGNLHTLLSSAAQALATGDGFFIDFNSGHTG